MCFGQAFQFQVELNPTRELLLTVCCRAKHSHLRLKALALTKGRTARVRMLAAARESEAPEQRGGLHGEHGVQPALIEVV